MDNSDILNIGKQYSIEQLNAIVAGLKRQEQSNSAVPSTSSRTVRPTVEAASVFDENFSELLEQPPAYTDFELENAQNAQNAQNSQNNSPITPSRNPVRSHTVRAQSFAASPYAQPGRSVDRGSDPGVYHHDSPVPGSVAERSEMAGPEYNLLSNERWNDGTKKNTIVRNFEKLICDGAIRLYAPSREFYRIVREHQLDGRNVVLKSGDKNPPVWTRNGQQYGLIIHMFGDDQDGVDMCRSCESTNSGHFEGCRRQNLFGDKRCSNCVYGERVCVAGPAKAAKKASAFKDITKRLHWLAKNSKGELIDLEQRPGPPRRQQVMVPVPTANPAPAVRTSAPTSSTKRMPSRSLSPAPAPKKGVKAPKSLSDASVQEIQEVQPRTHTQKPRTRTHVQKPQTRTHVEDVQPRVRPAQKIYGRSPELIMAEPEGKDIRRQFARVAERTSELSTELKNLGVMMGNSVKNVQKQLNKLNDKVLEDDSASSSESETDSQASYHQNE